MNNFDILVWLQICQKWVILYSHYKLTEQVEQRKPFQMGISPDLNKYMDFKMVFTKKKVTYSS